jgi:hypothetical protein
MDFGLTLFLEMAVVKTVVFVETPGNTMLTLKAVAFRRKTSQTHSKSPHFPRKNAEFVIPTLYRTAI